MDTLTKLGILAEAARFDAACTSSGVNRGPAPGKLGIASSAGCCHTFTADGRCITLLKVLMSNACSYDCAYCVNRSSASCARATFSPRELAELTVDFYKRNYIEGLFLSSGVMGSPDATSERMLECLRILRKDLHFGGYVHAKLIPGTSSELIHTIGLLADRLSVNLELPSSHSLVSLCPDKTATDILQPMAQIKHERDEEEQCLLEAKSSKSRRLSQTSSAAARPAHIEQADKSIHQSLASGTSRTSSSKGHTTRSYSATSAMLMHGSALVMRKHSRVATSRRAFAPAGMATQLIVGASPESDRHILTLTSSLYQSYDLKRVFFSAYIPMLSDNRLPEPGTPVPLRREHRLYQADWLMRYYGYDADELVTPEAPWLDLEVDPKLAWALRNIDQFPVEVMDASLEQLLRVPGIGPVGARRIVAARRSTRLDFESLRKLNITLKRARHFLTCSGKRDKACPLDPELIRTRVIADAKQSSYNRTRRTIESDQLSLF